MQYQDKKKVVMNLVENAIVAHANPVGIDTSNEFDGARRSWFAPEFRQGQSVVLEFQLCISSAETVLNSYASCMWVRAYPHNPVHRPRYSANTSEPRAFQVPAAGTAGSMPSSNGTLLMT